MVYSGDGIPEKESIAAHRHLASLLSNKLNREYSDMYGFVRTRMSLAIGSSNALLLHGYRYKKVYIR